MDKKVMTVQLNENDMLTFSCVEYYCLKYKIFPSHYLEHFPKYLKELKGYINSGKYPSLTRELYDFTNDSDDYNVVFTFIHNMNCSLDIKAVIIIREDGKKKQLNIDNIPVIKIFL